MCPWPTVLILIIIRSQDEQLITVSGDWLVHPYNTQRTVEAHNKASSLLHWSLIFFCRFCCPERRSQCLDAPQKSVTTPALTSRTHSRVSPPINTSVCTMDQEHNCGLPKCFPTRGVNKMERPKHSAQDLIHWTGHQPSFLFFEGILCSAAVDWIASNIYSKALHNLCHLCNKSIMSGYISLDI